jgi:hypothetical protein
VEAALEIGLSDELTGRETNPNLGTSQEREPPLALPLISGALPISNRFQTDSTRRSLPDSVACRTFGQDGSCVTMLWST